MLADYWTWRAAGMEAFGEALTGDFWGWAAETLCPEECLPALPGFPPECLVCDTPAIEGRIYESNGTYKVYYDQCNHLVYLKEDELACLRK